MCAAVLAFFGARNAYAQDGLEGSPSQLEAPPPHAEPPRDPIAEESLRADIDRIVSAEETLGWFLDQVALRNMYPTLLQSVCVTPTESRRVVLATFEASSRAAGVAKDLFVAAGRTWTPASKRALAPSTSRSRSEWRSRVRRTTALSGSPRHPESRAFRRTNGGSR